MQTHLTRSQVSQLTGLSPYRLNRLIEKGSFPQRDQQLSNRTHHYWRRADVERWIAAQNQSSSLAPLT